MRFRVLDPLSDRNCLRGCASIARLQLGPVRRQRWLETLRLHRRRLLVVAEVDGVVVGFKLGFLEREGRFYSWLGAVHPHFEGQGVGRRLMEIQHAFLKNQGCDQVTTRTRNRFRRMLILNLRCGFDIVGVQYRTNGEAHLLLLKELDDETPADFEDVVVQSKFW